MSNSAAGQVSFAADRCNTYPSEAVRFFVRTESAQLVAGSRIEVSFPPELGVESYTLQEPTAKQTVWSLEQAERTLLRWEAEANAPQGELQIVTRVHPSAGNIPLSAQTCLVHPDGHILYQTQILIVVKRLANSLQFLPELYQRDDFTNRFLMLFESFWNPLSSQIDTVSAYFDPHLTPPEFLPWIGSWFGLVLEDDLPEERKRDLLAQIAPIFARTGTKQALISFLSMYTGGEVQIREHIDTNFSLGSDSHLGYQMALGKHNRPNSFDVHVRVPATVLTGEEEEKFRRLRYQRRIEALINQFKPAHTSFRLKLEFIH